MKKVFIYIIRMYQVLPFVAHDTCRHTPTCSQYMIKCIEVYGVIKGLPMGMKRLAKCRPNGTYGYDPVPLKEEKN